ncbi:hypothetical protein U9M48_013403 [Paspalum notatum var. saurae]|uniref:Uncharacterized protein n=1 Tax=Paspalum notatum var. saurae TaxID=547442 RepID=A0AAQ3SZA9_PASNO
MEECAQTQAEEQQAEGQMEVDAEEEARADAELAASHAANPMMDGVETGGSSSGGTIRFQKTVSIRPKYNPADRSAIVLVGDRSWREVGWSRVGHRTPVNSALGAFCHFYCPGIVTLPNRDRVAAHKWSHWGLKEHVEGHAQDVGGGTCQGAVWKGFWAKYKEQLIQRHGQDYDWRGSPPDVEAIYHAGGGLRHGRWGLSDGALEYDCIPRPQGIGQGSSPRTSSRAQQEAQEKTRRLEDETRRLREDNDYMKTYLVELSQRLGSNVPEFRPPQLFPQVPPNYFVSTSSTQGPPLGDAQGS